MDNDGSRRLSMRKFQVIGRATEKDFNLCLQSCLFCAE